MLGTDNSNPLDLLNYKDKSRLPVIYQTEAAECGLACLAMISSYHGYKNDIVGLRQRFTFSTHGTNLRQLAVMAERLKMSSRAVRLELDELNELQLPCILHWDMCHFVVLKSCNAKKVTIVDPAAGEMVYSIEEFSKHFTGIAMELTPNKDFVEKDNIRRLKLNYFWKNVIGLKSGLIHVFSLSILLQLFAIVSPFYMQMVVDNVVIKSDKNLLLILAIGFAAVALTQVLVNALREYVILHLSTKFNVQMAANLFRHLIRLPLEYFEKRHMGDIVSRFGSLEEIKELITIKLVSAVVDSLLAVATLIAMFIYSPKLTLLVLFFVISFSIIRLLLFIPYKQVSEESLMSQAKQESCFMETLRAIQTIKIFQKESDRQNIWQNAYADETNSEIKVSRWNISFNVINGIIFGLENILVIYFAAEQVIANFITLGMLYAFMSYKQQFTARMTGLIGVLTDMQMIRMHLDRISDITFTEQDKSVKLANSITGNNTEISGNIEVKDLFFRYGESECYAVNNVSLNVNAGESIAIVAPSGGGKTTLLKCMMGLLTPEKGQILVDGFDIASSPKYRENIAAVMQDEQLLSGTIADNIACFQTDANMEKVQEYAKMASVHDEIMAMPMQYHTLIGDMGTGLSGGQKQRIVLARALYRKPKILFLDEATSHLDSQNESIVNKNVQQLKITRVIVAHREETIKMADRIVYLSTPSA